MNDRHDPTAEFLTHLERETRFALRRENAGTSGSVQGRVLARLRTVGLVVLSLGAGAGFVFAAEHVQSARRVERELAGNRVRLEVAARRLDAVRGRAELARKQFEAGVVAQGELTESERRVLAAERAMRHVQLEREALAMGGRALARTTASDGAVVVVLDLTAPLIGRRDFVSEHLRVDRESLAGDLAHARRELERTTQLRNAGLITEGQAERALAGVATMERRLASLDRRLALRAEFLLGRTSSEACERADLLLDAEARRAEVTALVGILHGELARAERRAAAGAEPAPEALRLELAEAEGELALVALEVDALR